MTSPAPHPHQTVAYLALGSNLGDREATLRSAISSLRQREGLVVDAASEFIETDPVGQPNQNRYLNTAVQVRTMLSARQLLDACLSIERAHGRERSKQQKWGPRTLDIDVLLFGDEVIDEAGPPPLRVPHPHMTERSFVLIPLSQIAPDVVHPQSKLTVQAHLEQLHRGKTRNTSAISPVLQDSCVRSRPGLH